MFDRSAIADPLAGLSAGRAHRAQKVTEVEASNADLDLLGLGGMSGPMPPLWLDRPLDAALGTLTGVQVLRELSQLQTGVIGVRELATRVDASKSSVARTLRQLEKTGLIEGVGEPYARYRFVRCRPLACLIERMFRLESPEIESIAAVVQDIAAAERPPLVAAWLVTDPWWLMDRVAHSASASPLAIPAVLAGSKYHLLLLTQGDAGKKWVDEVGERLTNLGRQLGIGIWSSALTFEQAGLMVAADSHLPELLERNAVLLLGAFPVSLRERGENGS